MLFCIPLAAVSATSGKTLPEVVSHAVLHNPDVNASWYTFRAAREEKRAAQGGYLPSVDLSAQVGSERTDTPITTDNSYSADSVRLSLTQMLFDGFAVRNNVARLDAASLARYYELRQGFRGTSPAGGAILYRCDAFPQTGGAGQAELYSAPPVI